MATDFTTSNLRLENAGREPDDRRCFDVSACSVQSDVSQHQSAADDGAISSNVSVRSAAAAAAEDGVHPHTSSSSDVHRTPQVNSGSSPDVAGFRDVILATAANAFLLLARQFATRQM